MVTINLIDDSDSHMRTSYTHTVLGYPQRVSHTLVSGRNRPFPNLKWSRNVSHRKKHLCLCIGFEASLAYSKLVMEAGQCLV